MQFLRGIIRSVVSLILTLMFVGSSAYAQQNSGELRGRVFDELDAVILGATVTAIDESGKEKSVTTNSDGAYTIAGLAPGTYTVRVSAEGFSIYSNSEVVVAARSTALDIKLSIVLKEDVTIAPNGPAVNTDPENPASATVLRSSDLDVLADDPDQLAADLQTLAGGTDGPDGTSLFVDGFSRGRIPSKASILEVRINSNPFAAEQDEFGFGRIEIVTKPGADSTHGQLFFNFNDESLNARNPFGPTRAPSRTLLYSGSLSGPIINKKTAYFLDFERRDINENAFVVARTLDSSFSIVNSDQVVVTPQRRTTFAARIDHQLNKNNTLVARYSFYRLGLDNLGVGGFSLPERAYDSTENEHTFQLTETMLVNSAVVNVTRFQYTKLNRTLNGDNSVPTINVQGAFVGGGSQIGLASVASTRFELQNTTTWTAGAHTSKAGVRLRNIHTKDTSPNNFGGTFIFSSLEQYRNVLLGLPGARPEQFTVATGNPQADVSLFDFSAFVQDDWRMRPDFTLSYGLRYETQTNIDDKLNFAPRLSFAWAPGARTGGKQPKTVIRGGAGFFYYRFSEDLTLLANRFNGVNQQQFIISNPNFFPNLPSSADLVAASLPQTFRQIAPDSKAISAYRATFSVERQLPRNTSLSISYIFKRDLHYPISRNINAPLPGTYIPGVPDSGVRPFGNIGNIFVFEPSGVLKSHSLLVVLNSRLNKKLTIISQFRLRREYANNDDSFDFPANSYDLSSEYTLDTFSPKVSLFVGTTYAAPWGVTFNTNIRFLSARRFNIITGDDFNGDGVFTDRPALATDLNKPGVIVTPFGAFDPNPAPGQLVIPRNFGTTPNFFIVNMRASKTVRFGSTGDSAASSSGTSAAGSRAQQSAVDKPYSLTFSVFAENLLNHTNPGRIIGNINSPLFGQANASQGNQRRISLQVRFNF